MNIIKSRNISGMCKNGKYRSVFTLRRANGFNRIVNDRIQQNWDGTYFERNYIGGSESNEQ